MGFFTKTIKGGSTASNPYVQKGTVLPETPETVAGKNEIKDTVQLSPQARGGGVEEDLKLIPPVLLSTTPKVEQLPETLKDYNKAVKNNDTARINEIEERIASILESDNSLNNLNPELQSEVYRIGGNYYLFKEEKGERDYQKAADLYYESVKANPNNLKAAHNLGDAARMTFKPYFEKWFPSPNDLNTHLKYKPHLMKSIEIMEQNPEEAKKVISEEKYNKNLSLNKGLLEEIEKDEKLLPKSEQDIKAIDPRLKLLSAPFVRMFH